MLAEGGYDPEVLAGLSADDRARGERLLGLLDLLNAYPVEKADDALVDATLVGIDRSEEQRPARLSFDTHHEEQERRSGRRLPIPDFISVAAVILIAVAVLWPVLSGVRQHSIDLACSSGLRKAGQGFGLYANDHGGSMPIAMAGMGMSWDQAPNAVNLEPLVSGGYCENGHLNCPGVGEHADASYSYQWQLPGAKVGWGVGESTAVVLGDRNPLIDAYRSGRMESALATSLNHGGRGQNVLFSDGQTEWLKTPVVGADDFIWLPRGLTTLQEGALPDGHEDVFLAH
jgi:hypothetical protein